MLTLNLEYSKMFWLSLLPVFAWLRSTHQELTDQALRSEGFSDDAIRLIVKGNLEVDFHRSIRGILRWIFATLGLVDTELHGTSKLFIYDPKWKQKSERARNNAIKSAVKAVQTNKIKQALALLGQALHIEQDSCGHKGTTLFNHWLKLRTIDNIVKNEAGYKAAKEKTQSLIKFFLASLEEAKVKVIKEFNISINTAKKLSKIK
jgi:type II secretory pathway pseudopilin PulG